MPVVVEVIEQSRSTPAIFKPISDCERGAAHIDGHQPLLWRIMADDVDCQIVGVEPLKVMPVHRIDDDLGEVRMRRRQLESVAHIVSDVVVSHRSTPSAPADCFKSSVVVHTTSLHRVPRSPTVWRTGEDPISETRSHVSSGGSVMMPNVRIL